MENEKYEVFKLDTIDRKLLFWMLKNDPGALPGWIEQTIREYKHHRGIEINILKLTREIEEASE